MSNNRSASGKALIFSAPSGSGKTTIVKHLLQKFDNLSFSISATTREKRQNEVHGKDYYFLSLDEFKRKIDDSAFVEWEQVYEDIFYGTLRSEVDRIWSLGKIVVFDVDVKGGIALKKYFGSSGLSVFVKVDNLDVLRARLKDRGTESVDSFEKRIGKAVEELKFEDEFDIVLVNDDLQTAFEEVENLYHSFTNQ